MLTSKRNPYQFPRYRYEIIVQISDSLIYGQVRRSDVIESIACEEKLQPDQIRALRQEKAVPVLQEMEAWLKKSIYEVPPKNTIGKAIAYTLNLWLRLVRYVEDGRFHIDNNMIENTIRRIAFGRKNNLFAGSHDAAQNAAMVYSFMATCKLNNEEPLEWFTNLLTKLPTTPPDQLHTLLPGEKYH